MIEDGILSFNKKNIVNRILEVADAAGAKTFQEKQTIVTLVFQNGFEDHQLEDVVVKISEKFLG